MIITNSNKIRLASLLRNTMAKFSSQVDAAVTEANDSAEMRAKIDPIRGELTDFLKNVNIYEEQTKDVVSPYFMQQNRIKGFATKEGTDKYYRRSQYGEHEALEVHPENFRMPFNSEIKLSSLGYGTYMGDPDDKTDYLMYNAIKQSVLSGGINHIDTAPNYRYMKSELTVGKAVTSLASKYGIARDQLFISSKAGYVPEDAVNEISQREMISKLVAEGVPEQEIVKESAHCLHPRFLELQLQGTLQRLNVDTLDVLYLQNPYEAQGPFNTDNVFFDRMKVAFEWLESQVEAGTIKNYGMATYSSLRTKPNDHKMHLNLQKVHRVAQKVVGEDKKHHFNYVQVPVNVIMPEAFVEPWQAMEEADGVTRSKMLVACCSEMQLNMVTSQPLVQGLAANIPISKVAVESVYPMAARHLQFIRSIPAKSLKSTLVGMKSPDHINLNLEIVKKAPMDRQEFFGAVKPIRRSEFIEEALDY